ncbi:AraC family transcriptional regulator [Burkholderia sp. BCC1972]|uniref:helix-turn-helix transcriptional regulator n=1 Tax=Burkholderia sp. BCC1972 TaxID=2817438 RepID=UPI002ABDA0CC|nr:AraC family transcriptional regulator [Burkholderia sp. BCC1972]
MSSCFARLPRFQILIFRFIVSTAPSGTTSSDSIPAEVRQAIVSQILPEAEIGITRLTTSRRNSGLTAPYELEDADLVVLQLHPFGDQDLWLDGRPAPFVPYDAGMVTVHDLDRMWKSNLKGAFDCIHFHLPRQTLEETADEAGGTGRPQLYLPPHLSVVDPVIHALGQALLPALAHPDRASQLFIDHVTLAFQTHVAHQYGGVGRRRQKLHNKLEPWQVRRAKAILLEHLDGKILLADVARECGMSRGYFLRFFHQTTGLTPHRWLIMQRIERSKEYMRKPHMSLSTIALACGFSDQSHFTRTFTRVIGVNPSQWRASNL